MYYVMNSKTGKKALQDDFKLKQEAEQAIVNIIRGTDRKEALKYYQTLCVRKA